MPHKKLDTITREEFDRRLDAYNERMRQELLHKESELNRVEQLLTHYEQTLDDIESSLRSEVATPSYAARLRKRLQELAIKTAEVAASL